MSKNLAKVTFEKLIQDSQDLGSDDEHMVSRVFFSLEVDGETLPNLCCDLKQIVGSDYAVENIEVGEPQGYPGSFNQTEFGNAAAEYQLSWVGPNARGIRVQNSGQVRMQNNEFIGEMVVEFEI